MVPLFGRVYIFQILFILAPVLMWSSLGLCGEIHEAVKNNNGAKVRELIRHNPDLVFSKDEDGFTPLHLAAANGYKEVVKFLLTTKAEVDSRDNAGSTPLHQAAAAERESHIVEPVCGIDSGPMRQPEAEDCGSFRSAIGRVNFSRNIHRV